MKLSPLLILEGSVLKEAPRAHDKEHRFFSTKLFAIAVSLYSLANPVYCDSVILLSHSEREDLGIKGLRGASPSSLPSLYQGLDMPGLGPPDPAPLGFHWVLPTGNP